MSIKIKLLTPAAWSYTRRLIVAAILPLILFISAAAAPIPSTGTIEVYFSPRGGTTGGVVAEIC